MQQYFSPPLVLSATQWCIEGCNLEKTILFYPSFVASFDTPLRGTQDERWGKELLHIISSAHHECPPQALAKEDVSNGQIVII